MWVRFLHAGPVNTLMPEWRNGILCRFKICRPQGHTGSSPVSGTKGTAMNDPKIEPHHESEGTDDDFFDDIRGKWAQMEAERRESDEFKVNNMEYDMSQADWFLSRVRGSDNYAQNLYAALCNNQFQKQDVWLVLKDQHWSCSWRYAGGVVADFQNQGGNYMDWYCSGIGPKDDTEFVGEGTVTDEIRADLALLGWRVVEEPNSEEV
jgi:hypothetical protein